MKRSLGLYRQWRLLMRLQQSRAGVTIPELEKHLECCARQVRRDLKLLQDIGFLVEHHQDDCKAHRRWRLSPKSVAGLTLPFSISEMLSLHLSSEIMAGLAGTPFHDSLATAMEKVRASLPQSALDHFAQLDQTVHVRSPATPTYRFAPKAMRVIADATRARQSLTARYRKSDGELVESRFDPYGLVVHGNAVYAVGHLAHSAAVRILKLSRFESAEPTGETFVVPEDFSLEATMDGAFGVFAAEKRTTRIRVRFTGWAATSVREQSWHASQEIVSSREDSLEATFQLGDATEFKRWVLGFGPLAEVLEPAALRNEIRKSLGESLAAYSRARRSR